MSQDKPSRGPAAYIVLGAAIVMVVLSAAMLAMGSRSQGMWVVFLATGTASLAYAIARFSRKS